MWPTVFLLMLATSVLAHNHTTNPSQPSTTEQWTPMQQHPPTINKKQDGGGEQRYIEHQEQILYLNPPLPSENGRGYSEASGSSMNQQQSSSTSYPSPAPVSLINTTPHNVPNTPHTHNPAMLEHAGSRIVLQIHPEYLKQLPVDQNVPQVKESDEESSGHSFQNPQPAGTEVALQIQPQFVLTGVHNPGLLHKHIQAPIYYNQPLNPAPIALNYPNHLVGGAKPVQHVIQNPILQSSPAVSNAQFAVPHFAPQPFQAPQKHFHAPQKHFQNTKLQALPTGALGSGKLSNYGGLHLNSLAQNQVRRPIAGAVFGQVKQIPSIKPVIAGDANNDDSFPDFAKMFEDYFKTGPFSQSFKNDNPETEAGTNLKINTNNDFPTGNFFETAPGSQAASTNQDDGEFKPCNFFKAANQKVADSNDDSEQYSSNNSDERDENGSNDDNDESSNRYYSQSQRPSNNNGGRYGSHRDEAESNSDKSSRSQRPHGHRHEDRPSRPGEEKEDEEDHSYNFRQHYDPRPPHLKEQEKQNEEHSRSNENDDNYSGRSSNRNNNRENHSGRPSNENRNRESYSGRPTNHNEENHSSRPHHHHHHDDDSYSGRPSTEQRVNRPHSDRNEGNRHSNDDDDEHHNRGRYNRPENDDDKRSSHHRNNKPSHRENEGPRQDVKTFHRYNFPSTPAYPRDRENVRDSPRSSESRNEGRRPPPPVREHDTVGYYSNPNPVVGTSGLFYRSEQKVITTNQKQM